MFWLGPDQTMIKLLQIYEYSPKWTKNTFTHFPTNGKKTQLYFQNFPKLCIFANFWKILDKSVMIDRIF